VSHFVIISRMGGIVILLLVWSKEKNNRYNNNHNNDHNSSDHTSSHSVGPSAGKGGSSYSEVNKDDSLVLDESMHSYSFDEVADGQWRVHETSEWLLAPNNVSSRITRSSTSQYCHQHRHHSNNQSHTQLDKKKKVMKRLMKEAKVLHDHGDCEYQIPIIDHDKDDDNNNNDDHDKTKYLVGLQEVEVRVESKPKTHWRLQQID
jgi:hypothetical protein